MTELSLAEHALSNAAPRMQVPAERNERRQMRRGSALGAVRMLILPLPRRPDLTERAAGRSADRGPSRSGPPLCLRPGLCSRSAQNCTVGCATTLIAGSMPLSISSPCPAFLLVAGDRARSGKRARTASPSPAHLAIRLVESSGDWSPDLFPGTAFSILK
jgi:hypothetical protein